MKKIKFLYLVAAMIILMSAAAPGALALDEPEVASRHAILVDAASGRIFFQKDAETRTAPASLTKIMTVLLAIEAVDSGAVSLTDMVTASEASLFDMVEDGSTANIAAGETMSLEDLLYCAMVESANEGCNIIAEHVSGSVSAFVELMNERAAELGCRDTQFKNTHGLPADGHYTTAYDMYLITLEAMSKDLFMEVCNTVSYTVPATNSSPERVLSNTNGLINANSPYYKGYYYEYARGVKTGYTSAAGYCLVSTAEKDGIGLIAVVMGGAGSQNPDGSMYYGNFADTITLYNWVFNNFSIQEILSSSELVCEVPVAMGADAETLTLRPKSVITALLPNDEDLADFTRQITITSEQAGEELVAPIAAGEAIGEITVMKNGIVYGSTILVASTNIELSKWQYIKTHVVKTLDLVWVKVIFWILIVILAVYVLLVIRYRTLHKRRREEARRSRQERERRLEAEERENIVREIRNTPRVPEPPQEKPPAPPEGDEEKAKRDYFEEFFKK